MARRLVGLLGVAVVCLGALCLGAAQASASGTITVAVQGQGSVTGSGIDCEQSNGPDCSEFYANECDPELQPPCSIPPGIELTATGENGYTFSSWTNCDSPSGSVCNETVQASETITAHFADTTAPTVSNPAPTSGIRSGSFDLSATASDNAAVSKVEFRVRGVLIATDTSAPFSASFDSTAVTDGSATIRATAYDAVGNASFQESTITIDNNAPSVSVGSGPNGETFGPGSTQTWTFTASDTTLQSVQCSLVAQGNPASFGACSGGNSSHAVSGLSDGTYVFTVRARDGLDRLTSAQRTFSIDGTPPETTIEDGPKARTTKKKARFRFASSEASSTFECSLDGGGYKPCQSDQAYNVKKGRHKLLVRATDAHGNMDGMPATWKWRRVSRG